MKILSISDIITNSSSEVFTYYTQESIKEVKALIDAILKAGGSNKTCDDLFEINLSFDEEFCKERLEEINGEREYSREELLQFALDYDDGLYMDDDHIIEGFEVIPKDPKNQEVAGLIAGIPFIFDTEAYNNW